MVVLFLLAACRQADPAAVRDLPTPCDPVDNQQAAPLQRTGESRVRHQGGRAAHLVAMLVDDAGELGVGISSRGLVTFDIRGDRPRPSGELLLDGLGAGSWTGPDEVTVSARDSGLTLVDVSRAGDPRVRHRIRLPDVADAEQVGDHLIAVTYTGTLHVYARPGFEEVAVVEGLGNPWRLARDGTSLLVADNTLGLVPVDVTDPTSPVLGDAVPTAGGALDVSVADGVAAVALGGAGVALFSLEPGGPHRVGSFDPTGSAVSVSLDDGLLWAATHEGVAVADVATPSAPLPLDADTTEEFAMAVAGHAGRAFVGDWSRVLTYTVDRAQRVPSLVLGDELVFPEGAEEQVLTFHNAGSSPLTVSRAWSEDPAVVVETPSGPIGPGEAGELGIRGATDGSAVCVATDDPARPIARVALSTTSSVSSSLAVGQPAVDFVLPDLDGETHRLSEHLGHPVVLAYFATW